LARALHDAAFASTPERAVEVWSLVCGIAVVVGLGLAPAAGVCAGGVVIVGGPAFLRSAGQRRARLVAAEVPVTLERVGAELRVGGTVAGAVATLAAGDGPLAPDMQRVETRIRLGSPLSGALRAWARERRVAGVEAAAGALALSATVGGRAADSLDGLASSLRDRLAVAAEARALSAQARYSAWVIGIAPAGYIVVSAVVDPRSLHALLGTDAGRACALAGVVLESAGAAWMRAIVRAGEMA
jgi:tight adherence protein B